MVPGTQASPDGQMLRRRKLVHVYADLRDQISRGYNFNPGNCSAQIDDLLIIVYLLLNSGI